MKSVILLLSGGIDSAVILGMLCKNKALKVMPVFIDYKQACLAAEMRAVMKLCRHYEVKFYNVPFPFYHDMDFKGLRADSIPFRNAIFLSLATAMAEALNINTVSIGICGAVGDSEAIYPDRRRDFMNSMKQVMCIGTQNNMELYLPLRDLDVHQVLHVGQGLHVPFEMTHSCYSDSLMHCGTCGGCVERKDRFKTNDIPDPTEYLSEQEVS